MIELIEENRADERAYKSNRCGPLKAIKPKIYIVRVDRFILRKPYSISCIVYTLYMSYL